MGGGGVGVGWGGVVGDVGMGGGLILMLWTFHTI